MGHEIDNVNWDDTPFITLNLADVMDLREYESDTLDTVLAIADRSRGKRGGVDPHNALVIPTSDPFYPQFRAMLESRANQETQQQKHWYLVSWASEKQHGCSEVPCSLPLAAGDMMGLIAYLTRVNPNAGQISIHGVFPLEPKRSVPETPETEPAAPEGQIIDVWINGKLARTAISEEAAWDMVEERHHADSYELLDSKTGISIAKG